MDSNTKAMLKTDDGAMSHGLNRSQIRAFIKLVRRDRLPRFLVDHGTYLTAQYPFIAFDIERDGHTHLH